MGRTVLRGIIQARLGTLNSEIAIDDNILKNIDTLNDAIKTNFLNDRKQVLMESIFVNYDPTQPTRFLHRKRDPQRVQQMDNLINEYAEIMPEFSSVPDHENDFSERYTSELKTRVSDASTAIRKSFKPDQGNHLMKKLDNWSKYPTIDKGEGSKFELK
ncbi:MAG: hypothetical protein AB7F64_05780 [Gammaproteobacteria bacterium]